MAMDPGKRDRRITLQRVTQTVEAGSGGVATEAWASVYANVWACVVPVAGREVLSANRVLAGRSARFYVPFLPGITTKDRISYDGASWNISSIAEIGRRDGMEILAEAVF